MKTLLVHSIEEMHDFGFSLGKELQVGDVITLTGPLGAGKTTLTQSIAQALGISGVTSPTFVIAREHRGTSKTPGLVHVDAYRLLDTSVASFDDLELEQYLSRDCIIIEWGAGLAHRLTDQWLEITIDFVDDSESRAISLIGHGLRWKHITELEQRS